MFVTPIEGEISDAAAPPREERAGRAREKAAAPSWDAVAVLRATADDVSLNGVAYWANIPARVWQYTIGGYQVLKKEFLYREQPLPGRPLTVKEVREVTAIARRIAAIPLLSPALDASYQAVTAAAAEQPFS